MRVRHEHRIPLVTLGVDGEAEQSQAILMIFEGQFLTQPAPGGSVYPRRKTARRVEPRAEPFVGRDPQCRGRDPTSGPLWQIRTWLSVVMTRTLVPRLSDMNTGALRCPTGSMYLLRGVVPSLNRLSRC